MKNPYENIVSFEQGFSFVCEGNDYIVATGLTETHEGTKYRVGIRGKETASTAMPLFEYEGLNEQELKEVVGFIRSIATEDSKVDDIIREVNGHIIKKHNESPTG